MSRKLLAGTLALGACILALVFGPMGERKLTHVRSLSALLAHPIHDGTVRVHGALVKGSLCKEAAPCGYRFVLMDTGGAVAPLSPRARVPVRYSRCWLPECLFDTGNVESDVTIEGKLASSANELEASEVFTPSPEVCRWLAHVADAQPMAPSDVPLCVAR